MPGADSFAYGFGLNPDVHYLPPGLQEKYKEPFWYNVNFPAIAAAAVVVASTNIQNDSYFVATSLMATNWDNATQNTTNLQPNVTPMLVRITDTSSGKFKMDIATPLANLFGTASQPGILFQRGMVFRPGGQIQVEVTNQEATVQFVRFTFGGFKVYNVPDSLDAM